MRTICLLLLAAGASGALVPRCLSAGVVNPHLDTDRAVDTRSAKTIVGDLVTDDMTSEQKALALFHWLRRVIYHSGPEEPLRHDFNLMINVFGYGSCYMQTHPLSHLYAQVGLPTRDCMHDGHHMIEVFYDGAWHCLDPHMTFYAYNRANPPAIASIRELQEDRTLAFDAVKEKRTGPAFLLCGDSPKWFAGKEGRWTQHAFAAHQGADEEFGAIRLPRGTRYVRTWKTGRFYKPHAFSRDGRVGPYHTCGARSDQRDRVNWPYWEPYVEKHHGRHYGTGFLEYAPDLRGPGWRDGVIRLANVTADADPKKPALHPATGGIEAEVVFFIDCPYIVTGAAMTCDVWNGGGADQIAISVSKDWAGRRRKWQQVPLTSGEAGRSRTELDLSSAVAGSVKGYWLRIVMRSKDPARTGIANLKVRTDFQLNPYALPQLLPGRNRLFVTAARNGAPWRFRLAWAEGANWAAAKEHKALIQSTSHEAAVEVAGPKLPRMESVEFAVDP